MTDTETTAAAPGAETPTGRWVSKIVGYDRIAPDQLMPHPFNPRIHPKAQQDALSAAIHRVGFLDPVKVNQRTGHLLDGHARVIMALSEGEPLIDVCYLDVPEEDEALILLTFDPIGAMAAQDRDIAGELLTDIGATGSEILDDLMADFKRQIDDANNAAGGLLGEDDAATIERNALDALGFVKPNPRDLPIDAIFTIQLSDASAWVASESGFLLGANSSMGILKQPERWRWKFPVRFIDNDYKDYDHAVHREAVMAHRPKYATVRDAMTKEQCAAAGIEHFELEQLLDWAYELAEFAEHVIVIPKYDCLDRIPARFMLGYSVLSGYGATPLPLEAFRGRRVHLLGGNWRRQVAYMNMLGTDVVSLDTNWINNKARFGEFVHPDGHTQDINALGLPLVNPRCVALAISLGNIGRALHDIYPRGAFVVNAPETPTHEAAGDSEIDGREYGEGEGSYLAAPVLDHTGTLRGDSAHETGADV